MNEAKIREFLVALTKNKQDAKSVLMISRLAECPFCDKAEALIRAKGLTLLKVVDDAQSTLINDISVRFGNKEKTYPRCFINGELVGGFTDLEALLTKPPAPAADKPAAPAADKPPAPAADKPAAPAADKPAVKPLVPTIAKTKDGTSPGEIDKFIKEYFPPAVTKPGEAPPLERGILGAVFPDRDLNWAPVASTLSPNLDPMYGDLKKCLSEGFAESILKSSPVFIDNIIESIVRTAEEDPVVHAHLERRIVQLIMEIKATADKDIIVRNLEGNCREVFVQLDRLNPKRRTRKNLPDRTNSY